MDTEPVRNLPKAPNCSSHTQNPTEDPEEGKCRKVFPPGKGLCQTPTAAHGKSRVFPGKEVLEVSKVQDWSNLGEWKCPCPQLG